MTVGELTAAAAGGASELLAAAVLIESKPELEEILADDGGEIQAS